MPIASHREERRDAPDTVTDAPPRHSDVSADHDARPFALDQAAALRVDEAASVPDSEAVRGRSSLLAKALGRDQTAGVARR